MTTEFPTLAALADDYFAGTRRDQGYIVDGVDGDELATLWRECITITTTEQLEALPFLSIVREIRKRSPGRGIDFGAVWERRGGTSWHCIAGAHRNNREPQLPALLLWHPDWSQK